jgi:hypothetical protein
MLEVYFTYIGNSSKILLATAELLVRAEHIQNFFVLGESDVWLMKSFSGLLLTGTSYSFQAVTHILRRNHLIS